MKLKLYCYPKCSTCREFQKHLDTYNVEYDYVDIKTTPPSVKELKAIHKKSKLDLKKLFNTSGNSYRELNLKDSYHQFTPQELYEMLSKDGMLIKRPILVGDDFAIIGNKKDELDKVL